MEGLIGLLILIVVICLVLALFWLLIQWIAGVAKLPAPVPTILFIVIVLVVLLWLVNYLGVAPAL